MQLHKTTKIWELPEGIVRIEADGFAYADADIVVIPRNCETIGSGAFAGMDLWELVVKADNVQIAEDAFDDPFIYVIASPESSGWAYAQERGWATGDGTE